MDKLRDRVYIEDLNLLSSRANTLDGISGKLEKNNGLSAVERSILVDMIRCEKLELFTLIHRFTK
jgi:hypothetical protein